MVLALGPLRGTMDRKVCPMSAQHTNRLLAVSTMGVLLIGGGTLGAAATASAAAPAHVSSYIPHSSRGCDEVWGDGGCDRYGDHGGFDQGGDSGGGNTAQQ